MCRPNAIPITYLFHLLTYLYAVFSLNEEQSNCLKGHPAYFDIYIYVQAKASIWNIQIVWCAASQKPFDMKMLYDPFMYRMKYRLARSDATKNRRVFVYFVSKQKFMSHYLLFFLKKKRKEPTNTQFPSFEECSSPFYRVPFFFTYDFRFNKKSYFKQ